VTGVITNTATVFSDSGDDNPSNDVDSVGTLVRTSADLQVTKVDLNDPVGPTDGFLYQIVVANNGPSDAHDVVVTDTLDSDVTFENASAGCALVGDQVICEVGTLPAGQFRGYLIAVKAGDVPEGSILLNEVVVDSGTVDPNLDNNTASEETRVEIEVGPSADLAITKAADPTSVMAGERVTYTLVVSNAGPQTATGVAVYDLVPFDATLIDIGVDNPDYAGAYCSAEAPAIWAPSTPILSPPSR